ncbi:hypothetical protein BDV93DRAFT_526070 [Ceratobasidium sp. AG-I]|nr:hypothetical protein BDV93DRAFT_526070 [Ceratobasidium sp. AG-I]
MADAIPLTGLTIDPELATGLEHLRAAKFFMLASFVVFVYDHMITFGDEVNRVWSREWTGATWLFALNRYFTELVFIVNLVSFHDPSWEGKACTDFIAYAGATTLVSIGTTDEMGWTVVETLYRRSRLVLGALAATWCGQMIVMGVALRNPVRVALPAATVGCILGFHGEYAAAFWLAPLTMDTIIFLLTISKTIKYLRHNREHIPLLHVILRDGVLYFLVILVANLFNCLIYYLAEPDLKVMGASFSHLMTILMISRLQLNLQKRLNSATTATTISSLSYFFDTTVTELGKDLLDEKCDDGSEYDSPSEPRQTDDGPYDRGRTSESEPHIEMRPIRPVSCGPIARDPPMFSLEEAELLENAIQVSPAIMDEALVEMVRMDV